MSPCRFGGGREGFFSPSSSRLENFYILSYGNFLIALCAHSVFRLPGVLIMFAKFSNSAKQLEPNGCTRKCQYSNVFFSSLFVLGNVDRDRQINEKGWMR